MAAAAADVVDVALATDFAYEKLRNSFGCKANKLSTTTTTTKI